MFEDTLGGFLSGSASAVVQDPAGVNPPNIIQHDHPFRVAVEWQITGGGAPFIGGQWEVTCYAESIGPGAEKQIGPTRTVSLDSAPALPTPREYSTVVNVPAFEADPANGLAPGAYKLVTLINYKNLGVPLEMAAFVEGPIIQVYEGQP